MKEPICIAYPVEVRIRIVYAVDTDLSSSSFCEGNVADATGGASDELLDLAVFAVQNLEVY
jgi:hypothetical protein